MASRDPLPIDAAHAKSYDELVVEGMALVRAYAPDWTDHNPSDPGITLVELLAYLTEILLYRAGRVSPDALLAFLRLVDPQAASDALVNGPLDALDEAIEGAMDRLSFTQFAATADDFERHARRCAAEHLRSIASVRALCVPGVELRGGQDGVQSRPAVADFSVVLAPQHDMPAPAVARLLDIVQRDLAQRCLLTARVHVVGPVVLRLRIGCRITLQPEASPVQVISRIQASLRRRFGPFVEDDAPGDPRPFGLPLHLSEIVVVLDATPGVDHVEEIRFLHANIDETVLALPDAPIGLRIGETSVIGEDARLGGAISVARRRFQQDATGEIEVVHLQPWELVQVLLEPAEVKMSDEPVDDSARDVPPPADVARSRRRGAA
jgi:hypothetical protein